MKRIRNLISRDASVVTGNKNLEPLFVLKDFPVFFGCVDSSIKDDLVADMDWRIDAQSGVIQLVKLIPLDILYQEQHVDGSGPTWQQYYKDFAQYIISKKQSNVLEIGGGSGALALAATESDSSIRWTMVEPNPLFPGSDRIKVIKGFLDNNFKVDEQFDAVIFSQVMEHAYDPREFLQDIAGFLKPGGRLIFAYPNLKVWLKNKFTNALNFEHTMLLTDCHVDYLLAEAGFETQEKLEYKNHSHFYDVVFTGEKKSFSLENKYAEYKKIFQDFVKHHEDMIRELNKNIAGSKDPVYLFGAHIFSIFLFAFGLHQKEIVAIIDNSKLKQNRRLYGTHFIIESPEILRSKGKVNIILKAGIYNEEIMEQIKAINNRAVFW